MHCCCFLVQGLEIILRTLFRGRECVQYTEEREVFGDEEVFTFFMSRKLIWTSLYFLSGGYWDDLYRLLWEYNVFLSNHSLEKQKKWEKKDIMTANLFRKLSCSNKHNHDNVLECNISICTFHIIRISSWYGDYIYNSVGMTGDILSSKWS